MKPSRLPAHKIPVYGVLAACCLTAWVAQRAPGSEKPAGENAPFWNRLETLPKRTETRPAGEILDDLAARAFSWFEAYRNPTSGLVADRGPNWQSTAGMADTRKIPCSIASVGYYLSILPDVVKTGLLTETQARERAVTAMRFLETHIEHHAGFLHHFLDMETGRNFWDSEVSVLDSSILFNGCIVASACFGGEVEALSNRLLDRVDWTTFFLPKEAGRPELLAMGWTPERGVFGPMDVRSSEFAMAYFLAVGAQAKGIDPKVWRNTAIKTGPVEGQSILNPTHGLFTSYYGLGWHRLEGRLDQEGVVDLWQNARAAALANRAYCRAADSPTYQLKWGGWWGISAGDSPRGYIAPGPFANDAGGTVWPTAALAALPWAAREIEQDLLAWAQSPVWHYVLGPYGLAPFNLQEGWIGTDLIGIDLGSFYLAVANHRRGTVWNLWKQHPIGRRAIERLYGNP